MIAQLIILLNGRRVGIVTYRSSRLSFTYDEEWRNDPHAYPLSLSMPLAFKEHTHAPIETFVWGLLPDSDRVLESWAQRFHVSAKNAFSLIANVGEDCAGAVQFVRPERIESLEDEPRKKEVAWLSETEVAQRLRSVRTDPSAGRTAGDTGQFSLAGAQPKTALLFERKRWGVPSGRIPTTHILKPPTGELNGNAENEHFCLLLARSAGLIVPDSDVLHFEDEIAIVVKRYDRLRDQRSWVRIHQEDMCQAMGLHPTRKYESAQGPGVRSIVKLIREFSSSPEADAWAFIDAIAFNWLIAGTDAHAKNYSLLLGADGAVRLAPLYDLASVLPYPTIPIQKAKLAMKIGGEYRLRNISIRNWEKLAAENRIEEAQLIDRIQMMAVSLPDFASSLVGTLNSAGLTNPILPRLLDGIRTHTASCLRLLGH